jgi:hypothetical protein
MHTAGTQLLCPAAAAAHLVPHHIANACCNTAAADAQHLSPEPLASEQHQMYGTQAVPSEALIALWDQRSAEQLLPLTDVGVLLFDSMAAAGAYSTCSCTVSIHVHVQSTSQHL